MNDKVYNIYQEKEDGFYLIETAKSLEDAEWKAQLASSEGKALIDEIETAEEIVLRTILYENGEEVGIE